jgi:DNA uptake protein ComE-like DNA-binding protein
MIRSSKFHTLSAVALAILLPVAAFATTTTAAKSSATRHSKTHLAAASHKMAKMPATDINTASKEDLMKLPGITDELAEKIIAGRPYKSKTELSKKSILTKAEYAKVRGHVIAKQEKTASTKAEKAPEAAGTPAPETGK